MTLKAAYRCNICGTVRFYDWPPDPQLPPGWVRFRMEWPEPAPGTDTPHAEGGLMCPACAGIIARGGEILPELCTTRIAQAEARIYEGGSA